MNEEWKTWGDGSYEVSNVGGIRRAKPGRRTEVGQRLTNIRMAIGYYAVRPVVDGRNVQRTVHSLVAEVFLGPRPDDTEINHIDGDKLNNHVSNLEYVTHAENMAHARRTGLSPFGERHGNCKLTDVQVSEIRARRAAGEGLGSLSAAFGVARSTLSQIANGHRRSA